MLYDKDILEEKVLLDWGEKASKKYVSKELSQEIHAKAEPFIKWLREAEEEDESESEEEDDDIVRILFIYVCPWCFFYINCYWFYVRKSCKFWIS